MRKYVDYDLKSKALKNGYCHIAKKYSLISYLFVNGKCSIDEYLQVQNSLNGLDKELLEQAFKINKATYNRNLRLENKISNMLVNGSCLFLTLTFTNDVLDSTTDKTRRRYVHYFLKSICSDYVANIDYGSKTDREHYHAIVLCDFVEHSLWKYGNIDFERIRYADSAIKLSKYISKLTNHAIKESVKGNRIIYSRPRKD